MAEKRILKLNYRKDESGMTDNEIIKALDFCSKDEINGLNLFSYGGVPMRSLLRYALDLINRQKGAIEQWKEEANKYQTLWCEAVADLKTAKSEAYKEFVKRFEKKIKNVNFTIGQTWEIQCALKQTAIELSEVSDNA